MTNDKTVAQDCRLLCIWHLRQEQRLPRILAFAVASCNTCLIVAERTNTDLSKQCIFLCALDVAQHGVLHASPGLHHPHMLPPEQVHKNAGDHHIFQLFAKKIGQIGQQKFPFDLRQPTVARSATSAIICHRSMCKNNAAGEPLQLASKCSGMG